MPVEAQTPPQTPDDAPAASLQAPGEHLAARWQVATRAAKTGRTSAERAMVRPAKCLWTPAAVLEASSCYSASPPLLRDPRPARLVPSPRPARETPPPALALLRVCAQAPAGRITTYLNTLYHLDTLHRYGVCFPSCGFGADNGETCGRLNGARQLKRVQIVAKLPPTNLDRLHWGADDGRYRIRRQTAQLSGWTQGEHGGITQQWRARRIASPCPRGRHNHRRAGTAALRGSLAARAADFAPK